MNTLGETIPHEDNGDIPVLELEIVNVELKLKKPPNEVDIIDVKYAKLDELCAAMDDPAPPFLNFKPLVIEDILSSQL